VQFGDRELRNEILGRVIPASRWRVNRMIMKADVPASFRVQQVSPVKDDWRPHFFLHYSQIGYWQIHSIPSRDSASALFTASRAEGANSAAAMVFTAAPFPFPSVIGDYMRSLAQQIPPPTLSRQTNEHRLYLA